jgi:uncharacterized protein YyaL (SSP411 family)
MSAHPHSDQRPANRLVGSTSPYLLQHAHNPVDWYPWGEEAIRRAREEDKPIFLSIGYSACHWCHVMERESFENEAIAAQLNRDFIAIKVDREERPDLDEIYMTATQIYSGSGGWPMSVFLTPDLKPFLAGTYFPPEDRWGRPGFSTLLQKIHETWRANRQGLEEQAERITQAIAQMTGPGEGQGAVTERLVTDALDQIAQGFDPVHGGFGAAPKFPPSMRLELLIRRLRQEENSDQLRMLTLTLDRMARGGMYDQVGGGFHRYSVDERWLAPHFEKMLYDNGLLARIYAQAYELTGDWYYGRVARETLDYALRELRHPEGGFYSATDADSEGEEGRFFVWGPDEVKEVLGEEEGTAFCALYNITPAGNFEGHSIPNLIARSLDERAEEQGTDGSTLDEGLAPLRRKLWEQREGRVHPLLDDKILTAWNGLMIRALAEGTRVFQDDDYSEAAEKAADFVLTHLRDSEGRLLRSFRDGHAHLNAYLEDYAYLSVALLDLYNVTGEPRWRDEGVALLEQLDGNFWDAEAGGYYFTSHDHEPLISRGRSFQDGATPSGSSMAALAHLRAAIITGNARHQERAGEILALAAPQLVELPIAYPNMLVAVDEYLELWPAGRTLPGANAVRVEAFLSRDVLKPGDTTWLGVRLKIAPGNHINSATPRQPHLIPTVLAAALPEGFTALRSSYPPDEEYAPHGSGETLSVYTGETLLGLELRANPDAAPGDRELGASVRLQPCDDEQCYPPLEARLRMRITVGVAGEEEKSLEDVAQLVARARPV